MAGRLIPYMMSVSAGFLLLLGAYGHVLLIRRAVRLEGRSVRFNADGKTVLSAFYSPAMLCAGAAFLLSLILMRGMLVYRYDDLKQWGSAAKWLTEQESLPHNEDFAGYLNHYLTPTFFTSFFAIPVKWATGKLVEYDLYAANTLFFSVGLSLPLGEFGWKHAKRVFGMFWLMFFGVTALYYHSIANLYVDVTFSAWVGGIIGFLLLRRRLKGRFTGKSYAFVLLLSAFTVFIKWGYGILGVLLILAAWGILEYAARAELAARVNKILRSRRFWLMLGIGAAALLFALWLLSLIFGDALNRILPGAGGIVTALFDVLFARTEKAALTTQACLSGFFTQVATRGSFGYGTLPAFALLTLLGYFQSSRLESKNLARQMRLLHTAWAIGFFGWTLLILLTYVSTFAFAEATIALSFNRYVGLYLMIGYFVQVILLFLPEEYTAARKIVEGKVEFVPAKKSRGVDRRTLAQVLLVLVLLLNTNADLITESSGWNPDGIVGYGHVRGAAAERDGEKADRSGRPDSVYRAVRRGAESASGAV